MTNREWMNSLSDEALVDLLAEPGCVYCAYYGNCHWKLCREGFIDWLKMEHEDDKNKCLKCLCYTCQYREAKCKNMCKDCVGGMWCITKYCPDWKERVDNEE